MSTFSVKLINLTNHVIISKATRGDDWEGWDQHKDFQIGATPQDVAALKDPSWSGKGGNNWGFLDLEVGAGGANISIYLWHGHSEDAVQYGVGWYDPGANDGNPFPSGRVPNEKCCAYLNVKGRELLVILGNW